MMKGRYHYLIFIIYLVAGTFASCDREETPEPEPPVPEPPVSQPIDTTGVGGKPFDINAVADTYAALAPVSNHKNWGPYNVHDPSIIREGEYFYSYSTDVAYGAEAPPGIQVRRSKNLIDWQFLGWVINGLPKLGADFIKSGGGTSFNGLWAPYIMKVGSEFRLYYSLSSPAPTPRLSAIGLLTSSSPIGPWEEKGLVVTSLNDNSLQTNAIDPTVIVDKAGVHWMYYGSAWDGIYILKLNATTGLAEGSGDKGIRIAQRGFTGNSINGNIEGPEIIYNQQLDKYYLFISYDWLETKYNVRVGRADVPQGPFYDFNGKNMNEPEDNIPMIIAPYKFKGHGGWQGTSHPSVFSLDGQYYIAHQGRPGVDKFFMVMHVRKLFWTEDGWPVASPQRYAGTVQTPVANDELVGTWEQIELGYTVVPGYSAEQIFPNFQEAVDLTLDIDGKINGSDDTWSYETPWLELKYSGRTDKVYVERGRDWENKKPCLIFTGLTDGGTAVWGKK